MFLFQFQLHNYVSVLFQFFKVTQFQLQLQFYASFFCFVSVQVSVSLLSEILGHPRLSEVGDFEPMFARSVSAVTPSEKKFSEH